MFVFQLCNSLSDIVTYEEVLEFVTEKWAPIIESLHSGRGGVIGDFLSAVLETVKDLPTHEV